MRLEEATEVHPWGVSHFLGAAFAIHREVLAAEPPQPTYRVVRCLDDSHRGAATAAIQHPPARCLPHRRAFLLAHFVAELSRQHDRAPREISLLQFIAVF